MRMFTKLSVVALSILSAATFAEAAPTERLPMNLPMASIDAMTAPAAVISESPIRAFIPLSKCNSNWTTCFKRFAAVPAGERWVFQWVSCTADTVVGGTFRHFSVQIADPTATKLRGLQYIVPQYQGLSSQVQTYAASQPIVLSANAGEVIYFVALSGGGMGGVQCALSGMRQKLA